MEEGISGGVQGTEEVTQGSVETPAPQVQQQSQGAQKGPGPWQKDLETLGLGEEYTRIVDGYLREKWQPRVTELEQMYAPYKEMFQSNDDGQAASDLLYALREDPRGTLEALTGMIDERFPLQQEDGETEETPEEEMDPRQEFIDQLMQEREQQQAIEEYQQIVDGYKTEMPDLKEDWFAKLVVANNGDVNAALEDYKELFADQLKAPEPPPPTAGDGPMAPQESQEFDGDLEKLVRNVVRRANAKN